MQLYRDCGRWATRRKVVVKNFDFEHGRHSGGRVVCFGGFLDQRASALITSPPARVPRAFQVVRFTLDLTNRTEPSSNSRLTPPGWNELGPMKESTLPKPALIA